MKNLSIRTRLIMTIALLAVLMLVIGFVGVRGMRFARDALKTVYEDRTIPLAQLASIADNSRGMIFEMMLALEHDPLLTGHTSHDQAHGAAQHAARAKEQLEASSKLWAAYLATYLTPEEKVLAADYGSRRQRFITDAAEPAMRLANSGDFTGLRNLINDTVLPLFEPTREAFQKLVQLQIDVADEEYRKAVERHAFVRMLAVVLFLGGVGASALFGYLLLRAIMVPLDGALMLARRIAEGDLRGDVDTSSSNEIGQMVRVLKEMKDHLYDVVRKVQQSSGAISHAAQEIATGNLDLSQRTEEQASSLEETASAMEELTSTVKQNSDNARHANQLTTGTRNEAESGGEVLSQAISAMAEISTASKKITDIIGVIDEIAFQTNLLALNAAVEAARAGEQGRGFAVVATEVRNLAQRSATAAKEIKALIQDTVEKVRTGSELVDRSGATLGTIAQGVKKASDIVSEIAAASVEQSTGIDEINKAVMQMDDVTQQNAALVEEAASAAKELESQTQALNELMRFFKIDQSGGHPAPVRERKGPQATPARPARAAPLPARQHAQLAPAKAAKSDWDEF